MIQRSLHVLVVDDTVVYRRILQNVVAEIPGAEVVGIAANGRIALDRLEQLDVDIVLLDVEMPEMDGVETLREIRQRWPGIGVVLLSGADRHSADITMKALQLGALDFVPKADTGDLQRNQKQLVTQLSGIMRGFALSRSLRGGDRSSITTRVATPNPIATNESTEKVVHKEGSVKTEVVQEPKVERRVPGSGEPVVGGRNTSGRTGRTLGLGDPPSWTSLSTSRQPVEVLLIGCSTGGPQALAKVIPLLPGDLGVPVLVVQHMPPVFTSSLSESLNRSSKLTVVEASDNQVIVPNTVYVAPGGRHMAVKGEKGRGEKRVVIHDEPPVNSVRPAVDVLFISAAQYYSGNTLSVILTGMGEDGLDGVRALRNSGGVTLTQSAATCVVYGMPRAIDQAGLADESVHLDDLAARITSIVRQANTNKSMPSRSGTS
jgi:two-component system chemotaxis response regulator CheB